MNPLRIAAWAVQLACDVLAPVKQWPDSEQPLIEPPLTGEELAGVRYLLGERLDTALEHTADNLAEFEPMPLFFGGFDDSSAGSTAEAGVDPGVGPTPSDAQTLGVGRNVTAGLLVSAAIGLREYAETDACEAPTYWKTIASQIDPK